MAKPKRDLKLERQWRQRVAQWRRSKQSVRAFCRAQQLPEASFYAWRAELARRDQERAATSTTLPTPAFVPVQVIGAAPLEVVLPSGLMVRVPVGTAPATVAQLVAALGAQP